jgi:hypothetical protein
MTRTQIGSMASATATRLSFISASPRVKHEMIACDHNDAGQWEDSDAEEMA